MNRLKCNPELDPTDDSATPEIPLKIAAEFTSDATSGASASMDQSKAKRLAASCGALWTVDDVAAFLAISPRSVWRLANEGQIPTPDLRMGRIVRWKPKTIESWLDQKARQANVRSLPTRWQMACAIQWP
jgi:predicted DNA-binding transcriptional regulator AlpA